MDSATPSAASGSKTVIGKSMHFKGEITGNEELIIEGKMVGHISLDSNVFVAKEGIVQADVTAQSVTIAGELTGNVVAHDRAEITAGGTLIGDVKAPRIVVNDGARLLGHVDMDIAAKAAAAAGGIRSSSGLFTSKIMNAGALPPQLGSSDDPDDEYDRE